MAMHCDFQRASRIDQQEKRIKLDFVLSIRRDGRPGLLIPTPLETESERNMMGKFKGMNLTFEAARVSERGYLRWARAMQSNLAAGGKPDANKFRKVSTHFCCSQDRCTL